MILELQKNKFINRKQVKKIVEAIEKREGVRYKKLKISILNDDELLKYNQLIYKRDYYTDIISLNHSHDLKEIEGELLISSERVCENQENYESNREMDRVVVHGLLHLKGMDDRTEGEKQEMRKKEDEILAETHVSRGTKNSKNV